MVTSSFKIENLDFISIGWFRSQDVLPAYGLAWKTSLTLTTSSAAYPTHAIYSMVGSRQPRLSLWQSFKETWIHIYSI